MKYQIDRENLINIIDESNFIDKAEANEAFKGLLRKTVNALCEYNDEVMSAIERRVLEKNNESTIGDIVSSLVSFSDRESVMGLSEMRIFPTKDEVRKLQDKYRRSLVFINADFNELRSIVGDNQKDETVYEGSYQLNNKMHIFKYKLVFDDTYLQMQDLVCALSDNYKMNNAIIFSPYIRKCFKIQPLEEIPEKAEPDYRFEKNGIPAITDSVLLWNFRVFKTEIMKASDRVPYGEEIKYRYHFGKSRSGRLQYALPQNNQTIIYEITISENGIDLLTDHELDEFILFEYSEIDKESSDVKKLINVENFYSNYMLRNRLANRRIISEGDIEYAINPFRNGESCSCEIVPEMDRVCIRYSSKYRHRRSVRAGYKKIKKVNIKFSAVEHMRFLDDYINYVLTCLEYYYPEIEWVGGN